ncbi:MAG: hypothetical protein ACK5Q5_19940 [Planctomycetaceae bacterium]
MSVCVVTPLDWLNSELPIEVHGDWVGISQIDATVTSAMADVYSGDGSGAQSVVILRRGVCGRMATLLNQLPGVVAALAVPVTRDDVLFVRASRASELQQLNRSSTLAEWLFRIAAEGTPLRWIAVPPQAEVDARALPLLVPDPSGAEYNWQLAAVNQVVPLHPQSTSRTERLAFAAGLLQLGNWLDESHRASQSIEGEGRDHNGDYWHAIMHRREPDYGNAKYWFRHVGRHPIFPALMEAAGEVLGSGPVEIAQEWRKRLISRGQWDPIAFVDLCQAAARVEASPLGLAARRIQLLEMLYLLRHSWSAQFN